MSDSASKFPNMSGSRVQLPASRAFQYCSLNRHRCGSSPSCLTSPFPSVSSAVPSQSNHFARYGCSVAFRETAARRCLSSSHSFAFVALSYSAFSRCRMSGRQRLSVGAAKWASGSRGSFKPIANRDMLYCATASGTSGGRLKTVNAVPTCPSTAAAAAGD
jgi:hypothetical protein